MAINDQRFGPQWWSLRACDCRLSSHKTQTRVPNSYAKRTSRPEVRLLLCWVLVLFAALQAQLFA